MPKKQYVVGFLFDASNNQQEVVLIKKRKPAWQKGKLNGLGGHIEPGETSLEAMRREFKEEAGVDVVAWRMFFHYAHQDYDLYCFVAYDDDAVNNAHTAAPEEGEVGIYDTQYLEEYGILPNLKWLIPMALAGEPLMTATSADS